MSCEWNASVIRKFTILLRVLVGKAQYFHYVSTIRDARTTTEVRLRYGNIRILLTATVCTCMYNRICVSLVPGPIGHQVIPVSR